MSEVLFKKNQILREETDRKCRESMLKMMKNNDREQVKNNLESTEPVLLPTEPLKASDLMEELQNLIEQFGDVFVYSDDELPIHAAYPVEGNGGETIIFIANNNPDRVFAI
jgi:hypothetical protein